ncbi:MAG: hypothetical protein GY830_09485 [Bacteroidetes bacterium]|nr:hypothetical protein [Bacteroidota bacterium]
MSYKFNYKVILIIVAIFTFSCNYKQKGEDRNPNKENLELKKKNLTYVPNFKNKDSNYYFLTPKEEKKFENSIEIKNISKNPESIFNILNSINKNDEIKEKRNNLNLQNIDVFNNLKYIKNDAGLFNLMGLDPFNNTLIKILFHDLINLFNTQIIIIFLRYMQQSNFK